MPSRLHHQFEAHARRNPDAMAVVCGKQRLTYAELDRRAARLAARLAGRQVGPGDLLGLSLDASAEWLVGMLGILKAGAAYVPLDPAQPGAWHAAILADCRPRLLVGQPLPAAASLPCLTPADWEAVVPDGAAGRRDGEADGNGRDADDDPMYVLYTSGTGGRPKGVRVSHANVARLFPALAEHLSFGADDVWSQVHSPAFGFSVWEIWGALAHGGRLVMVPRRGGSPTALLETLAREKVTVLSQTPTAFRLLSGEILGRPAAPPPHLRLIAFSGEPLDGHVLAPWLDRFGDQRPRLANLYALTETAGQIAYHRVGRADLDGDCGVPLGRPLADVHLKLRDGAGQPVAEGQAGELYVGGPAVALGYLGDPQLEAMRFLPDPDAGPGGRLYRTGDLAVRRADGVYAFAGRADRQVKVRGYRVELGAVEAALARHPAVMHAVVRAEPGQDGGHRLVAYLVPRPAGPPPDELAARMAEVLPHYAVPERFHRVDTLPLTANGKLDTAALPGLARPLSGQADGGRDAAPTVAATLADLWRELLQVPSVTAEDNFFRLGGYSLLTLKLALLVEERLGVPLAMADVFDAPSLGALTRLLETRLAERPLPAAAAAPPLPPPADPHLPYMRIAIAKAREAMAAGQPPYAACIVRGGEVVAAAHNTIWRDTDATAHAEMEAIRQACRRLGRTHLADCTLYTTAEPCSMCLSASAWADIPTIVYSVGMDDEARYGLAAPTVPSATLLALLNREITVVGHLARDEMRAVLEDWLRIRALEA